jgi:hypothetical protein
LWHGFLTVPPPPTEGLLVARQRGTEKKREFTQEMTIATLQDIKLGSTETRQAQSQTLVFHWTPLGQDADRNWTFRVRIESVRMEMETGDNKIAYDSSQHTSAASPLAEFYKSLVGLEFQVKLSPDFKVLDAGGRKELLARIADANPQMKVIAEQILKSGSFDDLTRALFQGTPLRDIQPGDSWTESGKLGMGPVGGVTTSYRYTYVGTDGPLDKFKIDGTLSYEPGAGQGGQCGSSTAPSSAAR